MSGQTSYTEENIRSLDWKEHIRMRPGMYIGKLGDGSAHDDGIYILIKEVLDNSIDEYVMGAGKTIEVSVRKDQVTIRDYGRGIPLGKVVDVVSKMNTGGKYDSKAFKKSVGLNGVGTKAVNALSSNFKVQSVRDGKVKMAEFEQGNLVSDPPPETSSNRKGTKVTFIPDQKIFSHYKFRNEYIEKMVKNYVYLNTGLTIIFNGEKYRSENGLKDLLDENIVEDAKLFPIIHLMDTDIEVALTYSKQQYSEEYHSFVNGQNTTQGGTHQNAFREALVKTIREFFGKNYDASDIRKSIVAAISIKVMEPVFESQTKTKLGSTEMGGGLPTVRTFINDFVKTRLDNYLHRNPESAEKIQKKILQAEKERKELSGIRKIARERAKKASLHNKKLRDCRTHLNNMKANDRLDSTLFITEGDSASGSITK
ncbi:MAG: ATP-binding protein, partial [Lutimonas sp.]